MTKIDNPFVEYGYFGSEYFCDRETETETLLGALHNGRNVTLMAPRRMGKTGLIKHVFEHIEANEPEAVCFYIDIFSTKTLEQMVRKMAEAIVGRLDSPVQSIKRKLQEIVASIRPTMTFDQMDGTPQLSLDLVPERTRTSLKQLFEYIKVSERTCYMAIDEFQQVVSYKEESVDALIRSMIQFIPNLHIIFSGSEQHLLAEMFMSPKHPFFHSTQIMTLGAISEDSFFSFAHKFFSDQGRELVRDDFNYLYNTFEGHTWYLQATLNRMWEQKDAPLDKQLIIDSVNRLVQEQEPVFQNYCNLLTTNQMAVLQAIAKEGKVKEPTAHAFITRHRLPSQSSVRMAIKSLVQKQLLFADPKSGYSVYDRFFAIWLRRM